MRLVHKKGNGMKSNDRLIFIRLDQIYKLVSDCVAI